VDRLAHAHDPALAVRRAAESSRTTHAAREAVDACRWFAILLRRALDLHASKAGVLATSLSSAERSAFGDEPLAPAVAEVAAGSFIVKRRRSQAPATWSGRSKQRCGRSTTANHSATERSSP
jgi:ADP-ribosylglycohydrolase